MPGIPMALASSLSLSLSGVVVVVVADVASQTMPASTLDPALDESTRQSQTANVCVLVK